MHLKRPNKKLEAEIRKAVKGILCPIHRKEATTAMDDENEPVKVEACCAFFSKDILVIAERMRKDFLYKDAKTRERLDRERQRGNNNS